MPCPRTAIPKRRAPEFAATLLAVLAALASFAAVADCTCVCVDGLNRPLCSEVTDIDPVCPPRVCPRAPAVKPLQPPELPPFDAEACSRQYLYNKYAGRYEWRRVCR